MKIFTNDNTNLGDAKFIKKTRSGAISGEHNMNYFKTQLNITTENYLIWGGGGIYANNDWNNSYFCCLVFNGKTYFGKYDGTITEFNSSNVSGCWLTGGANIGIEII